MYKLCNMWIFAAKIQYFSEWLDRALLMQSEKIYVSDKGFVQLIKALINWSRFFIVCRNLRFIIWILIQILKNLRQKFWPIVFLIYVWKFPTVFWSNLIDYANAYQNHALVSLYESITECNWLLKFNKQS